MTKKVFKIFVLIVFSLSSLVSFASAESHGHSDTTEVKKSIREEIKETIAHHLQDSYIFEITHGVSFPLPVILWDGGLHVFSGAAFHHGEHTVESKGNFYKLYHGKIYKTDSEGHIQYDEDHHVQNEKPVDFSITKNVFVIILMSALLLFLFSRMAKRYANNMNPGGAAKFLEPIIIFIRDDIAIPNIGKKHYKKYMSYLLTIFFFIWFLNLAGMTPLGIGVTNNIAVTFALALLTFLITQFTANKNYWGHIFWMPGVPKPMRIILAPIELLGVFIKPFALMIRLYANMTAGHIVIMSLIGLIFVFQNYFATGAFFGLTLFLSILELLVAALQAYIFTMLSALYFGAAVEEHH
jgi:F-type H+-transporting ATPase subunit a